MDIMAGVLPVPCTTPPWHRQHADLLVVANGFCWYARGVGELANRQRSFHGRSSLCDVSGKKGTRSTGWKVKGLDWIKREIFFSASLTRSTERAQSRPSRHPKYARSLSETVCYWRPCTGGEVLRPGAGHVAPGFQEGAAQRCPAPTRPAPVSGRDGDGRCADWGRRYLERGRNGARVLA